MAKLYWRIKRAGKWTWVAATPENTSWDLESFPYYDGPEDWSIILPDYDDNPVDKPEVYTDEE